MPYPQGIRTAQGSAKEVSDLQAYCQHRSSGACGLSPGPPKHLASLSIQLLHSSPLRSAWGPIYEGLQKAHTTGLVDRSRHE